MPWFARGTLHYLLAQGERLGIPRIVVDRAKKNEEIHRVASLLGQLAERHRYLPRDGRGEPVVLEPVARDAEAVLSRCEEERMKLHALAAASEAMIDEGRAAFGLAPAVRPFRVARDGEGPPPRPAPGSNGEAHARPPAKTKG